MPVLKCFSVCGVVTVGGLHCLSWADGRHYGGHLARHQHQPFSLRLVGHHSSSPSASHLAWNTKRFLVSLCSCLRTSFLGLATNSIFFCFLFVKNHWFSGRANQWPLVGETLFSYVPTSNSLVLVLCATSRTTEKQGNHKVCCARLWGPRTQSKTADANLDLLEMYFSTSNLDCEKPTK